VAVLLVELLVAVVADLEDAVFDAKGVGEVLAQRSLGDFDGPTGEVLAVEQRHPVLVLGHRGGKGHHGH
jgi:hypothetical protein